MRLIDADALDSVMYRLNTEGKQITRSEYKLIERVIFKFPTIDAVPVIKCKDCKHRPTIDGEYENGFDVIFPDMRCPCQCDDGWYNWMPEDDWYCGNAQEKQNESKGNV